MVFVDATPSGYKPQEIFEINSSSGKSLAQPALLKGKTFIRDQDKLQGYSIDQ